MQPRQTSNAIGKLCVGGDWACANGDLEALRDVARQLANHVGEPIHRELSSLVTACEADSDRAIALWTALKTRLHRDA